MIASHNFTMSVEVDGSATDSNSNAQTLEPLRSSGKKGDASYGRRACASSVAFGSSHDAPTRALPQSPVATAPSASHKPTSSSTTATSFPNRPPVRGASAECGKEEDHTVYHLAWWRQTVLCHIYLALALVYVLFMREDLASRLGNVPLIIENTMVMFWILFTEELRIGDSGFPADSSHESASISEDQSGSLVAGGGGGGSPVKQTKDQRGPLQDKKGGFRKKAATLFSDHVVFSPEQFILFAALLSTCTMPMLSVISLCSLAAYATWMCGYPACIMLATVCLTAARTGQRGVSDVPIRYWASRWMPIDPLYVSFVLSLSLTLSLRCWTPVFVAAIRRRQWSLLFVRSVYSDLKGLPSGYIKWSCKPSEWKNVFGMAYRSLRFMADRSTWIGAVWCYGILIFEWGWGMRLVSAASLLVALSWWRSVAADDWGRVDGDVATMCRSSVSISVNGLTFFIHSSNRGALSANHYRKKTFDVLLKKEPVPCYHSKYPNSTFIHSLTPRMSWFMRPVQVICVALSLLITVYGTTPVLRQFVSNSLKIFAPLLFLHRCGLSEHWFPMMLNVSEGSSGGTQCNSKKNAMSRRFTRQKYNKVNKKPQPSPPAAPQPTPTGGHYLPVVVTPPPSVWRSLSLWSRFAVLLVFYNWIVLWTPYGFLSRRELQWTEYYYQSPADFTAVTDHLFQSNLSVRAPQELSALPPNFPPSPYFLAWQRSFYFHLLPSPNYLRMAEVFVCLFVVMSESVRWLYLYYWHTRTIRASAVENAVKGYPLSAVAVIQKKAPSPSRKQPSESPSTPVPSLPSTRKAEGRSGRNRQSRAAASSSSSSDDDDAMEGVTAKTVEAGEAPLEGLLPDRKAKKDTTPTTATAKKASKRPAAAKLRQTLDEQTELPFEAEEPQEDLECGEDPQPDNDDDLQLPDEEEEEEADDEEPEEEPEDELGEEEPQEEREEPQEGHEEELQGEPEGGSTQTRTIGSTEVPNKVSPEAHCTAPPEACTTTPSEVPFKASTEVSKSAATSSSESDDDDEDSSQAHHHTAKRKSDVSLGSQSPGESAEGTKEEEDGVGSGEGKRKRKGKSERKKQRRRERRAEKRLEQRIAKQEEHRRLEEEALGTLREVRGQEGETVLNGESLTRLENLLKFRSGEIERLASRASEKESQQERVMMMMQKIKERANAAAAAAAATAFSEDEVAHAADDRIGGQEEELTMRDTTSFALNAVGNMDFCFSTAAQGSLDRQDFGEEIKQSSSLFSLESESEGCFTSETLFGTGTESTANHSRRNNFKVTEAEEPNALTNLRFTAGAAPFFPSSARTSTPSSVASGIHHSPLVIKKGTPCPSTCSEMGRSTTSSQPMASPQLPHLTELLNSYPQLAHANATIPFQFSSMPRTPNLTATDQPQQLAGQLPQPLPPSNLPPHLAASMKMLNPQTSPVSSTQPVLLSSLPQVAYPSTFFPSNAVLPMTNLQQQAPVYIVLPPGMVPTAYPVSYMQPGAQPQPPPQPPSSGHRRP